MASTRSKLKRVSSYSREPSASERAYYAAVIRSLVSARRSKGWTQEQLNDRLGVTPGLVAKWESYAKLPSAFMFMCWAHSLDVRLTIR